MNGKQPLVVFSDDWGRHPSSCQHLVSHLLEIFEVTWVNTIGTRLPSFDRAAVTRSVQKLREWTRRKAATIPAAHEPRVLSPLMWPTFRTSISRSLNRQLVTRHLLRHVPGLGASTVLTTVPVVADLVDQLPASRWIYYCVDDFSEWPGLDGQTLQRLEEKLIDSVDYIVAAGDRLAERIRQRRREPVLLTHGVDLAHWRNRIFDEHRVPALSGLERPLILFWGLIDERLDVPWLDALGQRMNRGTIVLAGPEQNAGQLLRRVPRLNMVGAIPYRDLPLAGAAADVLIMPYADLPVTRAMQPLKLKEYLATGKPVVVSRLPSVNEWTDCLDVADTPIDFATLVLRRVESGTPFEQNLARKRLECEDWVSKARTLQQLCLSSQSNDA
jgi:glycosyltransferase involved in cell wall biosynthesis